MLPTTTAMSLWDFGRGPWPWIRSLQAAPQRKGGIRPGDSILSINGARTPFWDQVKDVISSSSGDPVSLVLLRGDDTTAVQATVPADGTLGFYINQDTDFPYVTVHYGFLEYAPPVTDPVLGQAHRMLLVLNDLKHLQRVRSPFYALASDDSSRRK